MAYNFCQPPALDRDAVDGDIFANLVVIANLEPGRLAVVGHILRRHPNGRERKEAIVSPDFRGTLNRHVRHQMTPLTEFDIRPNHAIRPDLARLMHPRTGVNNRGGMNIGRGHRELAPGINPKEFSSVSLCASVVKASR